MRRNFIVTIIMLFVIISAILILVKTLAPSFLIGTMLGGNAVLAILSITSYLLVKRKISAKPQAFVQAVMSGSLLKLFACMIGLVTYILINKPHVHKPSIFILMAVYAIYTAVETWLLSLMAREVN